MVSNDGSLRAPVFYNRKSSVEDENQAEIILNDAGACEIVEGCLVQLIHSDLHLLQLDLNERTITGQLARYLQTIFKEWHVDCEYNRNHDDAKRLKIYPKNISKNSVYKDTVGRTVFPDIIVHKRGTTSNFIVIEVKKTTSDEDSQFDIRKLQAFKRELGYRHAIFLNIGTGERAGTYEMQFVNSRGKVIDHKINGELGRSSQATDRLTLYGDWDDDR
mgnify:CR=1 FL=1